MPKKRGKITKPKKKSSTNVTKGKAENLSDRKRQIKAIKGRNKKIMKDLFG